MKTTQFLWLAPVAGMLMLTACKTTSDHSAQAPPTPAPVAAPPSSSAQGGNSLMGLTKNAPGLVSVGDTFTYDITATAQSDVGDVTVSDTVPSGASFVSSDPAATQDGGRLTWKLGNMAKGESKSMKVTLKADQQGELSSCATVSASPRVCVTTTVGKAALALTKTGPATAALGSDITYNITVQNTGNTPARDVVVTDHVPDGLSAASGQKDIKLEVGTLGPGESKALPVVLHADQRGQVLNKAVAASSNAGQADAQAPTTIVAAGVKITKSTQDKTLFINRAATYDIEVSNTGDVDLTGVSVTDTADSRTVIATAEGATVNGSTAKWDIGTLPAGQKKNFTAKVISKVPGRFTNSASVAADQGLHDTAQADTEWRGVTGILVEALDDPDPIQVGEVSTYTIRITNQGSSIDIRDLNVVVTIPPELELVPNSASDNPTVSGNTLTWPTTPAVPPKGVVTHTYTAKGIKAGDARTKVAVTTSSRQDPIEKFESTTVY